MSKQDNSEEGKKDIKIDLPEVEQELSKVATNPKQSIMILVGIVSILLYLVYNFFISSKSSSEQSVEAPAPTNIVTPTQVSTDSTIPAIPTLPSPPKLEDPTLPPPPPPPAPDASKTTPPLGQDAAPQLPENIKIDSSSASPSLPFDDKVQGDELKKRLEAKRKSSIVLIAGKESAKTPEQLEQESDFKYRGDMRYILGRGKMINAVIESNVNTDFGGEIRALVSRDVYSEWGRNILIPKGSRVIGNYVTGINGAYSRVAIEWTRIDLSTGYSVNLSGTAMDSLGRKGVHGRMDNKFKERFSNAVLRSAFNITLASALDKIVKPPINSQAAATQTSNASSIRNVATSIFTQQGVSDALKRAQICAGVRAAITDKTSTAYSTIDTTCNTLNTQTGANDNDKLTSLINTVNSTADSMLQATNTNVQQTKAQQASEQAFTDITDTAKELLDKQKFDPTITIDQGTPIKIYVNKDYKFPIAALKKVAK